MNVLQLTDALKYGFIGLGAVLAILSYFLITKEQKKAKPSKQILGAVYVFMFFSVLLMVLGIVGNNSTKKETHIIDIKSGFSEGALNGTWNLRAMDTTVMNNRDFKSPTFGYAGKFDLSEKNGEIYFKGTMQRKTLQLVDTLSEDVLQFEAHGPINNNYVSAQYYIKDLRSNGFGCILVRFNNAGNSAVVYFLYRPSRSDEPFGFRYGELTRVQ